MTLPRRRSRILGASVAAVLIMAPASTPALTQGHSHTPQQSAPARRTPQQSSDLSLQAQAQQQVDGTQDPSTPAKVMRRRHVLEEEERAEELEHGEEEEHTHDDEEYTGGSRGVTFEAFQAMEPGMSLAVISAIVGSKPTINHDLDHAFDQDQVLRQATGTEQRLIATWPAHVSGSICVTFDHGKASMLSVWGLKPSKLVDSGQQLGITTHARRCLYIGMRQGDASSVIGAQPTHTSPETSALSLSAQAHSPAAASTLTDLHHTQWQAHDGALIALVHSADGEVLAITSTV